MRIFLYISKIITTFVPEMKFLSGKSAGIGLNFTGFYLRRAC